MSRPAGQTWRQRVEQNRGRHVAARYARAHTGAERAAVEFDRARRALRRLEKRDPAAAQVGWEALGEVLARFADRIGPR
jgi:hypothetical protein